MELSVFVDQAAMEGEPMDHWSMRVTRQYLVRQLTWTEDFLERDHLGREELAVRRYFQLMLDAEIRVRREVTLWWADATRPMTSPTSALSPSASGGSDEPDDESDDSIVTVALGASYSPNEASRRVNTP